MKSTLKEKLFHFALRIIKLYKSLCKERINFALSKQQLPCNTSVDINTPEVLKKQSETDFVHSISIAQRESDESLHRLKNLFQSEYLFITKFN